MPLALPPTVSLRPLAFRRNLGDLTDLPRRDAAPDRDGYLEESASFGEGAGTIRRLATGRACQLTMVLGIDDVKSRSGVRGSVAMIPRRRVSGLLSSSTNEMPCAGSDSEPVNHRRRSRRTRSAKSCPRVGPGRCPPGIRLVAHTRRKHHELCEIGNPSIAHQFEMAPMADVRRETPPVR
jgi:hypothetical protein